MQSRKPPPLSPAALPQAASSPKEEPRGVAPLQDLSVRRLLSDPDTFYAFHEGVEDIETFVISPSTVASLPAREQVRLASVNTAARRTVVGAALASDLTLTNPSLLGAALASAPRRFAALGALRDAAEVERSSAATFVTVKSTGLPAFEAELAAQEKAWAPWLVGGHSLGPEIVAALASDSPLRRALATRLAPSPVGPPEAWVRAAHAGAEQMQGLAWRLAEVSSSLGASPSIGAPVAFLADLLRSQIAHLEEVSAQLSVGASLSPDIARWLERALLDRPCSADEERQRDDLVRALAEGPSDETGIAAMARHFLEAAIMVYPARLTANTYLSEAAMNAVRDRRMALALAARLGGVLQGVQRTMMGSLLAYVGAGEESPPTAAGQPSAEAAARLVAAERDIRQLRARAKRLQNTARDLPETEDGPEPLRNRLVRLQINLMKAELRRAK